MKLILDMGNTRTKVGLFDGDQLLYCDGFASSETLEKVVLLMESYVISHALFCAVGKNNDRYARQIIDLLPTHVLSHESKLPFISLCLPFSALGLDRIGLVAAGVKSGQGPILVIDAGTCVTYDLLDAQNIHHGGAISPGLNMRYKAMQDHTANLPLLRPQQPTGDFGLETHNAMHFGAVHGLASEIDGFIEFYRERFAELTIILTGGDAEFLRVRIKNDIFAHSNFLLEGLNFILDLNINSCSGKSS